jgi:hypothetical protein
MIVYYTEYIVYQIYSNNMLFFDASSGISAAIDLVSSTFTHELNPPHVLCALSSS